MPVFVDQSSSQRHHNELIRSLKWFWPQHNRPEHGRVRPVGESGVKTQAPASQIRDNSVADRDTGDETKGFFEQKLMLPRKTGIFTN